MSHLSQASVLLWAIVSTFLLVFLVWHLWKFDKFVSLGWKSGGSRDGTFKRLMTYSYLLSIPLLLFYAVTLTSVKYYSGYFITPDLHVVPLPYDQWSPSPKRWITSLYVAFSISWALEIVSHLEELNFWFFLFALRAPENWFRSKFFFTWAIGSFIALVGLPTVALVTRGDPVKSEAWIFFAGSIGDFLITAASLRVLWKFPRFIALIKSQGADPATLVRLRTYSELNNVRVFFRFVFVVPLLILAVDGIRPGHSHIVNENAYATDLLAMLAALGCAISSVLTLLVFFPRSIAEESGYSTTQTMRSSFVSTTGSQSLTTSPSFIRPTHYRSASTSSSASSASAYTYPKSTRTNSQRLSEDPTAAYLEANAMAAPRVTLLPVPEDRRVARPMPTASRDVFDTQDRDLERMDERGPLSARSFSDVGYDALQATGTRYRDVTQGGWEAQVEARERLHPYIRHFKSPLDLYDHVDGTRRY